jgi:hypothetical protein
MRPISQDTYGIPRDRMIGLSSESEQAIAQVASVGGRVAELPQEFDRLGVERTEIWRRYRAGRANAQNHVQQSGDEVVGRVLERRPVAVCDAREHEPATAGTLVNM